MRAYWLPIAYMLPIHLGVIIAIIIFSAIGIFTIHNDKSNLKTSEK